MVASITEGTAFDKHGRPFRRRNVIPVLCLFVVLALAAGVIWVVALNQSTVVPEAVACNAPPPAADATQTRLGEPVSRTEMAEVMPARLADTKVRVLNASGQAGQAADVSGALQGLGFAQPTAANDPVYANSRLECQGQIRFGEAGRAAAAAVWLVAPCTELFQDGRTDDTVDLAVGTEFSEFSRSDDIDAMLAGLRPDATQPADAALLTKIHSATC
ncbi:envelope integrity protein Cei [Arthrobacter sp. SLBN-53]|uniref:envelope integrity protein Cei n=1 Tax=Arthrobacter sp. SLBN-53 TaxID=2768412 RepID=UPI0011549891|nr:envelope integrity protein Cei [Arthrobacter sp. SLBN-53]TQK31733.1 LytR cell envelope-related transcriptional attenuator [Arthrobacter sp. SLBN-53]